MISYSNPINPEQPAREIPAKSQQALLQALRAIVDYDGQHIEKNRLHAAVVAIEEAEAIQPKSHARYAQSAIKNEFVCTLGVHDFLALSTRYLRGMSHAAQIIGQRPDALERHIFWDGAINCICSLGHGDAVFVARNDLRVEHREGRSLWTWASLAHNANALPAAQIQQLLASSGIHIALEHIPNLHIKAAEHMENKPISIFPPMREHIAALAAFRDHFNSLHLASMPEAAQEGAAA